MGIVRTVFALIVASVHLLTAGNGSFAVIGFFVISGYLMTLVMHSTYGYGLRGQISFVLNRGLRLIPMYWFVAALTLISIFWIGNTEVKQYHAAIYVPQGFGEVLSNLTLIFSSFAPIEYFKKGPDIYNFIQYTPVDIVPRLVPPTWALTTEIFYYVLICLGVSRTSFRVYVWIVISMAYYAFTYAHGFSWWHRYFPILAASLPFSIGSLIYFLKVESMRGGVRIALNPLTLLSLVLLNTFYAIDGYEVRFFINLALVALLVFSIASGERFPLVSKKLDKSVGDLSYPIYILHWFVALVVSFVMFGHTVVDGTPEVYPTYFVSMAVIILLSIMMIMFIDRPVQKIRQTIKIAVNSKLS